MKRWRVAICALLLAGAACSGLAACGAGIEDSSGAGGSHTSPPTTITTATGAIASDAWGYTDSALTKLTTPARTEIVVKERTLLRDAFYVVVTGISFTKVSFSSDATTLSAAQRASAPGTLVSYVDLAVGLAKNATPALAVSVDATPIAAGQTLKVAAYEPLTAKWLPPQSVVVDNSGKVTFPADQCTLWGIFR